MARKRITPDQSLIPIEQYTFVQVFNNIHVFLYHVHSYIFFDHLFALLICRNWCICKSISHMTKPNHCRQFSRIFSSMRATFILAKRKKKKSPTIFRHKDGTTTGIICLVAYVTEGKTKGQAKIVAK